MTDRSWAAALMSQQIWCWGQDVKRPEGNWLAEIGFVRNPPPEHRKDCSSVYTLAIGPTRRIVLRGFGVYIGDDEVGGLFIERYGFAPKFSPMSNLACPPWSDKDLPAFDTPKRGQQCDCMILLLRLLDWIRDYEFDLTSRLGIDYRKNTIAKWNNGKRLFIPAEQMASSWRKLSMLIVGNFDQWILRSCKATSPVPTNQDTSHE
jgi:hypothetical protein